MGGREESAHRDRAWNDERDPLRVDSSVAALSTLDTEHGALLRNDVPDSMRGPC